MRRSEQMILVAFLTASCCIGCRSSKNFASTPDISSGVTNGISVTVEIKDGRRKIIAVPPNIKPIVLTIIAISGVHPFCSHDYGGEYILRTVPGKGEVRIPFDFERLLSEYSEHHNLELLDKDLVVLPHMRSGTGFGPPQTLQSSPRELTRKSFTAISPPLESSHWVG